MSRPWLWCRVLRVLLVVFFFVLRASLLQFGAGLFMCLFFGSIFASMAEAVWVIVYPNSC